jgi:hypothetical protein
MSYVANYEPLKRPYICKVLTASSGEEFHVSLNYSNDSEREEMSAELIYEHLENCITYIEDKAKTMSIIPLNEPIGMEPWPAKGWGELEWANAEINLWFNYIYYKAEGSIPESDAINLNLEVGVGEAEDDHTHDGSEDHTHDSATGDETPNA